MLSDAEKTALKVMLDMAEELAELRAKIQLLKHPPIDIEDEISKLFEVTHICPNCNFRS